MTTIYLVRHGQKEANSGDPELTKLGWQQAHETGTFLQGFPIDHVVSSPFKRTLQTAEAIAAVINKKVAVSQSLVERMNWNDDSVPKGDFFNEWVKSTNNRHYQPKYGESSWLTGQRLVSTATSLAEKYHHIVLVTHGGAIIDYLRTLLGDKAVVSLQTRYNEGDDYCMMNCAVTKVVLAEQPRVELLNYTGHLSQPSE